MLKLLLALIIMGAVLFFAAGDTQSWLGYDLLQRLTYMSGLVALGAITYFICLYCLGFRLADFKHKASH